MGTNTTLRPIDEVNKQLGPFVEMINQDPTMAETTKVALVTFDSSARIERALSDVGDLNGKLPTFTTHGNTTSWRAWTTLLRSLIESDTAAMVEAGWSGRRALVVVLTDGKAMDDPSAWQPALTRLTDPAWPLRPNIVALGYGDADRGVLKQTARVSGSLQQALSDRGLEPWFLASGEATFASQVAQVLEIAWASLVAAAEAADMDPNGEIVAEGTREVYPYSPLYLVIDTSPSMGER